MDIIKIILIVLGLLLLGGGYYYFQLLNGFKKFILFENDVKKNPNDALVKQYMIKYRKTFFPKKDSILQARGRFYHIIKESPQVSYDTKRELRHFLEAEGVNLLAIQKKANTDDTLQNDEEN